MRTCCNRGQPVEYLWDARPLRRKARRMPYRRVLCPRRCTGMHISARQSSRARHVIVCLASVHSPHMWPIDGMLGVDLWIVIDAPGSRSGVLLAPLRHDTTVDVVLAGDLVSQPVGPFRRLHIVNGCRSLTREQTWGIVARQRNIAALPAFASLIFLKIGPHPQPIGVLRAIQPCGLRLANSAGPGAVAREPDPPVAQMAAHPLGSSLPATANEPFGSAQLRAHGSDGVQSRAALAGPELPVMRALALPVACTASRHSGGTPGLLAPEEEPTKEDMAVVAAAESHGGSRFSSALSPPRTT
jgi:hypothetical protein